MKTLFGELSIKGSVIRALKKHRLSTALLNFYDQKEHKSIGTIAYFLFRFESSLSILDRLALVRRLYRISFNVDCPHNHHQVLSFVMAILSVPQHVEGCVVEAGSYKGGSTCKFSIAAGIQHRKLIVFDSFEGIPENTEPCQRTISGSRADFPRGAYGGSLDEVRRNVVRYGDIDACEFVQGWFEDTMRDFTESIVCAYLDVDLASSTRTCLKYLYPRLVTGGRIYSQDGHLPLVIDVFNDVEFWKNEVGCEKPYVHGLGRQKLVYAVKE